MPRPDLTEESTAQILDAFADCIGKSGVAATSLQDVADGAGVHKSIIRHYVGSKEDLVNALTVRTVNEYRAELQEVRDGDPGAERLARFVDLIFETEGDAFELALFDSVSRSSGDFPEAYALVEELVGEVLDSLVEELRLVYPTADDTSTEVVGVCVWGMALAAEVVGSEQMELVVGLRMAAGRLIETLGEAA